MTVLFDTATLEPADRSDSWNDAHRRIFFPIGVRFTEVRSFDPGDFLVGTLLHGRTGIEQAGRSGLLGPLDVSSWDSSRPFRVTHFEPLLLLLVVPEQILGLRRKAMQARTASRLALHGHEAAQRPPSRQLAGELLLSRIRSYIERHLGDPSLGPESAFTNPA